MSGHHTILSVFIDASDFSTANATYRDTFPHLGAIQRQAWEIIAKRVRIEFPPNMVLMDPINGVFEDDQGRKTVAQCLHSRIGFNPDVTERFREMVLEAYSQVLGAQASCIHVEAADSHPAALFRR